MQTHIYCAPRERHKLLNDSSVLWLITARDILPHLHFFHRAEAAHLTRAAADRGEEIVYAHAYHLFFNTSLFMACFMFQDTNLDKLGKTRVAREGNFESFRLHHQRHECCGGDTRNINILSHLTRLVMVLLMRALPLVVNKCRNSHNCWVKCYWVFFHKKQIKSQWKQISKKHSVEFETREERRKNKTIQFSSDATFLVTTFSWKFKNLFDFLAIDKINDAEK